MSKLGRIGTTIRQMAHPSSRPNLDKSEADYLMGQAAGLSFEVFAADDTLRRAFVRSLEIIGEAAKKVPEELRKQLASVLKA